ncbi:hypothetical protein FRC01_001349 [Tulasnella sp. 417]|nr:hypothetical protein FRC01_001349 [Tulasnella sp. 417]
MALFLLSQFQEVENLPLRSRDNVSTSTPATGSGKTATIHPPSCPPNLRFSNNDLTNSAQAPQGATFNPSWSNDLSHGEAHYLAPCRPNGHMDEESDEYDVNSRANSPAPQLGGFKRSDFGDSKRVPSGGHFLRKLSWMLSDKTMAEYIKSEERQGSKAFKIPNIEAFVAHALPRYFPDMNQWGSFQKQLSNYGYKKKDRDKESGTWVLRNKNPSDVLRQPKEPVPRKTLQERRPPATTPAGTVTTLQPQDQPDLHARMNRLQKELNATRSELAETRALLSETRTQLQTMMDVVRSLTELAFGDNSSYSMPHPGPAVATLSNAFLVHEGTYSGAGYESITQTQIDPYDKTTLQDSFSQGGTETAVNTIPTAFLVQHSPAPQPPGLASSPSPAQTLPVAEDQQPYNGDFRQNIFMHGGMENVPGSMALNHFRELQQQQQNVDFPTGSQNSTSTSAAPFADQTAVHLRNSYPKPHRTLGGRARFGGSEPVPPPPPPENGWLSALSFFTNTYERQSPAAEGIPHR